MKSDCIQIKINNESIQFSGVEVDSTSDLNTVLKKINRPNYEDKLNLLSNRVDKLDSLDILKESDLTRIADYKVGNISMFTLQSLLQNRGDVLSSEISNMANVLNILGINNKTGGVLLTNTKTPQLYIGEYRSLLELPENFTTENVLSGMHMLFIENQLNNINSSLFNNVKKDCDEFIRLNSSHTLSKKLSLIPDELNRVKRFFYEVSHMDNTIKIEGFDDKLSDRFIKYAEQSLRGYKPLVEVNSNYFSQKQLDYLANKRDNQYDSIKLNENSNVKLKSIVESIEDIHNTNYDNKALKDNTFFINKLKEDLLDRLEKDEEGNYKDDSKYSKILRLKNLKELNSFQIQLRTLYNKDLVNKEDTSKIYEYILDNYFTLENEYSIEILLNTKIREQYKTLPENTSIPQLSFPVFRYDENIIFKPSNKISFYEFEPSEFSTKLDDPNETKVEISTKWINEKIDELTKREDIIETLNTQFSQFKNTKLRTIKFSEEAINKDNYRIAIDAAIANGFDVVIPVKGWTLEGKSYTRNEFVKEFYSKLSKIQDLKYSNFKTAIMRLEYRLSKLKINDSNIVDGKIELVTNDIDIINYDLNTLLMLDVNSKYNLKIKSKEKINYDTFSNYLGLKHQIPKKKNYFKIIAEPIENVTKIEKANITSESFNGSAVIDSIIKDLKLNVFTFTDDSKNAPSGYVKDGKIFLNTTNEKGLNTETFLHELSHLLIAGIKVNNYEGYLNLIDSVNEYIQNKPEDIDAFSKDIRYSNLSKYDLLEEYLVKKFSQSLSGKINDFEIPKNLNISSLAQLMFKLNEDISDDDISRKTVASLMATYGSNYNNLFNRTFPLSDHLNELKLAEYKQRLIEEGLLTEECE